MVGGILVGVEVVCELNLVNSLGSRLHLLICVKYKPSKKLKIYQVTIFEKHFGPGGLRAPPVVVDRSEAGHCFY